MSVKMIVTRRSITPREKARRRFRWWYKTTTPNGRMQHLMSCDGCVGCTAIHEEIRNYREENDVVR